MTIAHSLILAIVISFAGVATAAEPQPGSPLSPFRLYTSADGMTQTRAHAITQDLRGYLWIATVRGLNRFDGQQFTPLTTRHGLRVNTQFSLHVSSDGDLWSGDVVGGVTRIRNGRVIDTFDPPRDARGRAQSIAILDGWLYRSITGQGLFRTDLLSGRTERVMLDGPAPRRLLVSKDRLLFIAQDRLFAWQPGEPLDPVVEGYYAGLSPGSDGRIFVRSADGQLYSWTGLGLASMNQSIAAKADAFALDSNSRAWHTTAETLTTPFGSRLLLPVGEVIDVFLDRDDVVWVAGSNGLVRYLGRRFQHLPLGPAAPARVVFGGAQDAQGTLWFCTAAGLLARYPDGRVLAVADVLNLPRSRAVAAQFDGDDHVFVSFPPTGVFRIPVSMEGPATLVPGTEGWLVTDIAQAMDGTTWILGARRGLLGLPKSHTPPIHLPLPDGGLAISMAALAEGGLVVAVRDVGLVRMRDGDLKVLPNTQDIEARVIHVSAKSEHAIWFTSTDGGVYQLKNGTLEQYARRSTLTDQSVYIVEPLDDGTAVLGTERGLYHLDPASEKLFHFGPLEGFLGGETNARATFRGIDGRLWIGTIKGATRMDTLLPVPSIPALSPYISGMATNLKQVSLEHYGGVIPADDRGMHVDYVAVSAKNPDGIEYSYRLRGVDEAWSLPTSQPSVRFASLGPGSYTFEVRARHSGDKWSQPAARSIVVEPPFWETHWFRALAISAAALTVIAIVQLRIRRERAINLKLRQLVAERTEHLEEEITERKRSEAALMQAQATSLQAQRQLEALNAKLHELALADSLTGLPNRRAFERALLASLDEDCQAVSVLFLDLNGFKQVNDTHGHDAGDELIRIIGRRLSTWARTSDFVARLGGDEFVVVARACGPEGAQDIASRVGAIVAEPVTLSQATVTVSASIGIACCPLHANTSQELIRKADLAMYYAKRVIKAPAAFFDELPAGGAGVSIV